MRGVIQRVSSAEVRIDGRVVAAIGRGILLLVGIHRRDTEKDAEWLLNKALELRIFPDNEGKMNRSVVEAGGELLVVSQFTLHGDCRKGRRPSYSEAMTPTDAAALYQRFVEMAAAGPVRVATGEFAAMMDIALVNDGPVTLLLDSEGKIRP